jgi:hypothetical protein
VNQPPPSPLREWRIAFVVSSDTIKSSASLLPKCLRVKCLAAPIWEGWPGNWRDQDVALKGDHRIGRPPRLDTQLRVDPCLKHGADRVNNAMTSAKFGADKNRTRPDMARRYVDEFDVGPEFTA